MLNHQLIFSESETGAVMMIGGYYNAMYKEVGSDAEIMDFRADATSTMPKPSKLPVHMIAEVAALVDDQVMACGGHGNKECFAYNHKKNQCNSSVIGKC